MPKNRGKRSLNKLPPFVPITWDVLNSRAYKELPYAAAKALPYFLGKIKISFNDPLRFTTEFPLSYPEAKTYGFAPATFSKVIQKLVYFGFIDPVDKGGLRGCGKSYNLFRLSKRWKFYGEQEFKSINWQCFQPRTFWE
jgi:hypothetical protein